VVHAADPVGAFERKHVTELAEDDLVWDADLGRWRRVTSVVRYTAQVSGTKMIKVVLDLSTWTRREVSGEAYYDVLLDAEPSTAVRPLSATERRRIARRGASADVDEESTLQPPAAPATTAAQPPAERSTPAADQTDHGGDVRARREELRLSRATVAELCGLTPGALWRVENGRPKDDELDRVRAALDAEEARRATH